MRKIVFPGSFDPMTVAHLNLINRALLVFDQVIVVVVVNPNKNSMFSVEKRVKMISNVVVGNVIVDSYDGLITNYCVENDFNLLLRGIRNSCDLMFEQNMVFHNRLLNDEIETVCLLTEQSDLHISSSAVRELLAFGADVSHLVPSGVLKEVLNADI